MTPPERSSFKRWAHRVGIALAVLLVVGIAGEVLLRIDPGSGGQAIITMQLQTGDGVYAPDPELGALLAPSRRDVVETLDYTYTFQTDHAGFANPEPWPSRVDVAVLGDSLLDGGGVGMDGQFTTLLEHRLGGRTVLNLGLPGGGTEHQHLIYRRFAKALHPRLVIAALWVVWDIDNTKEFDHWQREHKPDPDYTHYRDTFNLTHQREGQAEPSALGQILHFLHSQLSESYLLRAAYRGVNSVLGGQVIRERVTFPSGEDVLLSIRDQQRLAQGMDRRGTANIREIFFRPLEQLRTEVEAEGGRFLIVLVPSKEELYGAEAFPAILRLIQEVRAELASRGLPVLDLYPVFREGGREHPPFYRADIHLNQLGNQIVAKALAQWIEDQNVFPGSAPAAALAGTGGN